MLTHNEEMEDGEGFPGDDNQSLAVSAATLAVVEEGTAEAEGEAHESLSDEEEDMTEEGGAAFAQAAMGEERAGLIDAGVEADEGDQGFGGGETVQVTQQGEEEGQEAVAQARDGAEATPGIGIGLAHLLTEGQPDLMAAGLEFLPEG